MEYYLHTLKEEIKSVSVEASNIRNKEQKFLSNGRKLLGIFSRKHNKGEIPIVAPQYELPENPSIKAREDYERFWGLHNRRTHTLRKTNRHNFLAYGYLRGKSYREVEEKSREAGEPIDVFVLAQTVAEHKNLDDNSMIDEEILLQNWIEEGNGKLR